MPRIKNGSAALLTGYKTVGLVAWNTIILFILLNSTLYLAFWVRDSWSSGGKLSEIEREHRMETWKAVYTDLQPDQIRQLLAETWRRPQIYAPLVEFRERPYTGKYVNVSEAGYRQTKDQGPWPPDREAYNIFLFGGSTAFAYGVSDDETMASYLQDALRRASGRAVRLYNFGVGSYFSSQERVLFSELLIRGLRPDMALFLDGVNEPLFDEPAHTPQLRKHFDVANDHTRPKEIAILPPWVARLPMMRAIDFVQRRTAGDGGDVEPQAPYGRYEGAGADSRADRALERYLENRTLIEALAKTHGVTAVFVWQPTPYYKYDIKHHLFADRGVRRGRYLGAAYAKMAARWGSLGGKSLWAADMQETLTGPLYVDNLHYSARMNLLLAEEVATFLMQSVWGRGSDPGGTEGTRRQP